MLLYSSNSLILLFFVSLWDHVWAYDEMPIRTCDGFKSCLLAPLHYARVHAIFVCLGLSVRFCFSRRLKIEKVSPIINSHKEAIQQATGQKGVGWILGSVKVRPFLWPLSVPLGWCLGASKGVCNSVAWGRMRRLFKILFARGVAHWRRDVFLLDEAEQRADALCCHVLSLCSRYCIQNMLYI